MKELFDKMQPRNTYIDSITNTSSGIMVVNMMNEIITDDTQVLKIHGVPHFRDVMSNETLYVYDGPELAIVNKTNGCSRGIYEKSLDGDKRIYSNRLQPGWQDQELDKWRRSRTTSEACE